MKHFIVSLSIVVMALVAGWVLAPSATVDAAGCKTPNNAFLPRWFDDLCVSGTDNIASPNSMGGKAATDAQTTGSNIGKWLLVIVMNLVKTLLTVVGYVTLGFIIWGGFKYMTQGDNASGTAAARKTIQNAVIGLVLSILSVGLINFVTGAITQ